jgi:hypothetical protein
LQDVGFAIGGSVRTVCGEREQGDPSANRGGGRDPPNEDQLRRLVWSFDDERAGEYGGERGDCADPSLSAGPHEREAIIVVLLKLLGGVEVERVGITGADRRDGGHSR